MSGAPHLRGVEDFSDDRVLRVRRCDGGDRGDGEEVNQEGDFVDCRGREAVQDDGRVDSSKVIYGRVWL